MRDISRLGGPLAESLASDIDEADDFQFDRGNVPALPPVLSSDEIVITKGLHCYGDFYRETTLELFATQATIRALGVLTFSSLFASAGSSTDIRLTHPASAIKTIRLKTPDHPLVFALEPLWYRYWPQQPDRHPWSNDRVDSRDLPTVWLQAGESSAQGADAWERRDTILCFGTYEGTARMGQFLLDVGSPGTVRDEFQLESELGFRGLGPGSAELTISLPGSFRWRSDFGLQ